MSEDVLAPLLSDSEYEYLLAQFDQKEMMVLQDVFREYHIDPEDPKPSVATSINFLIEPIGNQQHQSFVLNENRKIHDDFNPAKPQELIEKPEKNSTSHVMINQRYQIMRYALNKDNNLLPLPENTIYEYFNIFRGKIRLEMRNREIFAKIFDQEVDQKQIDKKIAEEKIQLLDYWNKQVVNRTNLTFQSEKSYRFYNSWPPLLMDVPEEYFSSDEHKGTEKIEPKLETPRKRRKRRRRLTPRKCRSKQGNCRKIKRERSSGKKAQIKAGSLNQDAVKRNALTVEELFDSISNGIFDPNEQSQSSSSSTTFFAEPELTEEVGDNDEAPSPIQPNNIPMKQLEYVNQTQALSTAPPMDRALQPWTDPTPSTRALVPVTSVQIAGETEIKGETDNVTFVYDENAWNNLVRDIQIGLFNLNLAEEVSANDDNEIAENFESDEETQPEPLLSVVVSLAKPEEDSKSLFEHCSRLFEIIKSSNPIDPFSDFCAEFRAKVEELKRVEGEFNPILLLYESWIACFLDQEYSKAMQFCERIAFPEHLHRPMQEIWDHSLEMLESIRRNHQKLSSVQRFRLKQKHEYPETIWDGKRVKYGMSVLHKKVLIFFYDNYSKNPTSAQKDRLAKMVNATPAHVSTFFKNRRSRSGDTRRGGKTLKQEISETDWKILEEMLKSES